MVECWKIKAHVSTMKQEHISFPEFVRPSETVREDVERFEDISEGVYMPPSRFQDRRAMRIIQQLSSHPIITLEFYLPYFYSDGGRQWLINQGYDGNGELTSLSAFLCSLRGKAADKEVQRTLRVCAVKSLRYFRRYIVNNYPCIQHDIVDKVTLVVSVNELLQRVLLLRRELSGNEESGDEYDTLYREVLYGRYAEVLSFVRMVSYQVRCGGGASKQEKQLLALFDGEDLDKFAQEADRYLYGISSLSGRQLGPIMEMRSKIFEVLRGEQRPSVEERWILPKERSELVNNLFRNMGLSQKGSDIFMVKNGHQWNYIALRRLAHVSILWRKRQFRDSAWKKVRQAHVICIHLGHELLHIIQHTLKNVLGLRLYTETRGIHRMVFSEGGAKWVERTMFMEFYGRKVYPVPYYFHMYQVVENGGGFLSALEEYIQSMVREGVLGGLGESEAKMYALKHLGKGVDRSLRVFKKNCSLKGGEGLLYTKHLAYLEEGLVTDFLVRSNHDWLLSLGVVNIRQATVMKGMGLISKDVTNALSLTKVYQWLKQHIIQVL